MNLQIHGLFIQLRDLFGRIRRKLATPKRAGGDTGHTGTHETVGASVVSETTGIEGDFVGDVGEIHI